MLSVLGIGSYPNVEVAGRADDAMNCESVSSDDEEGGALALESGQDVPEILVQRGSSFPRRITRTGALSRG